MSTAASHRPPSPQVLVVDDEENLRHLLRVILERDGHVVAEASNGTDALHRLARLPSVRVVLCDVRMPELDGFGFLEAASSRGLSVVMMSAYGGSETAIDALSKGAFDYISKPFRADEIRSTVRRILEQEPPAEDLQPPPPPLVVESKAMRSVEKQVGRLAVQAVPVLLTGESGVGKNLVADYIHAVSGRRSLQVHDCAEAPLEASLAGDGTLVLDHLEALSEEDLAVVEGIVAAGAPRLIGILTDGAALPESLESVFTGAALTVPALAKRTADLESLISLFVEELGQQAGRPQLAADPGLAELLQERAWPGNVRQLRNLLQQAILFEEGDLLSAETLMPVARFAEPPIPEVVSFGPDSDGADLSIKRHSARLEAHLIGLALVRTAGNRTQAARLLDISYKALAYKVRDYGLDKK